ncbi:hypothetical protein [Microvirus mar26]|uniref:Uncharacterized protein n=2 Tax=unclassified Microviridae TaxID=117574 RepID=A0A8F5RBR3_9VIRU|nr:hypothetical protein [Microvirus mar24]QXN75117.1 hypothetical protein [Microvirus mar26]
MVVYTYRYMWKLLGSSDINFKIVTDTDTGHSAFIDQIKGLNNLESAAREYLHEYDTTKIAVVDTFFYPKNLKAEKASEVK